MGWFSGSKPERSAAGQAANGRDCSKAPGQVRGGFTGAASKGHRGYVDNKNGSSRPGRK